MKTSHTYLLIGSDEIDLSELRTCKIGKTLVMSLHNIVLLPVTVRMQNYFQKQFYVIKKLTVQCINKFKMEDVVNVLASIVAVGENKLFSEGTISNFRRCVNASELMGALTFYYNPLDFNLLYSFINKIAKRAAIEQREKEKSTRRKYFADNRTLVMTVYGEMTMYKESLEEFMKGKTIEEYCEAVPNWVSLCDPPPDFKKMVVWFPAESQLKQVKEFQECFTNHNKIQRCAMILGFIGKGTKECTVTWFVASTVVSLLLERSNHTDSCVESVDGVDADKELKANVFRSILEKYSVTKLEIAGACVYRLRKPQEVSSIL